VPATEIIILLLRLTVVIILYLFLWQVLVVIWRDLRRPTAGEAEQSRPLGKLLLVSSGDTSYQPGHSFALHRLTRIGRGSDNSVVLDDGFTSTSHAELRYQDGSWWVLDLGSRNGSWINDKRVRGQAPIRYGDVLTIGRVKLKLAR
jgi:hypothetical protein